MSNPEPSPEVRQELQDLRSRLAELERRNGAPARRFPGRTWALVAAVAAAGLAGVALASSPCANGMPFCFAANEPAVASEMNTNFAQLKTWLEAKTGATGTVATPSGDITTGKLTATAYAPSYRDWNTFLSAPGAGGAGIVNDNTNYKALMIVGNTSASGPRVVRLFDDVVVSGNLTVNGNLTSNGYDVACAHGYSGAHYGFCCRMNVRTGATECKNGTSTTFTTWGSPSTPFAAGPDGRYSLSCAGLSASANFPICCRTDNAGATSCVISTGSALNWVAVAAPF